MRKIGIKNIVSTSRLMKSVVAVAIMGVMVLSSLQSIGAEPSMIKNNSELKEDVKNPERGTIRTVPYQYLTIQDAIDASSSGDVVVVYPEGSPYQGDGNRDLDFGSGKNIVVRSTAEDVATLGTDAFWAVVESTVIDCQGSASAPHRGFFFHSGETISSKVRGLKIVNAVSPNAASQYWTLDIYPADLYFGGGGAIACVNNPNNPIDPQYTLSPTIEYNILENNQAYFCGSSNVLCGGGAILSISSSPTISHNIIQNNFARGSSYGNHWGQLKGGGILCVNHDYGNNNLIIENNTIINNIAVDEGYSNFGFGGGIACYYYSSPIIRYNHIEGNKAGEEDSRQPEQRESRACAVWAFSDGGGIYLENACDPIITHNNISNNQAIAADLPPYCYSSPYAHGGGIYSGDACNPTFTYNEVVGNKALGGDYQTPSGASASGGGFWGRAKAVPDDDPISMRNTFCYNIFTQNYAIAQAVDGDGLRSVEASGGGISFANCGSNLYAHNNIISYNKAIAIGSSTDPDFPSVALGGGIKIGWVDCVTNYNSSIIGNEAVIPSGGTGKLGAYGGGIMGRNPYVDRCIIMNNQVRVEQQSSEGPGEGFYSPTGTRIPACGGGIAATGLNGAAGYISNCIIAGNIVRADNQIDTVAYKALGGGVAIAGPTSFDLPYPIHPVFGFNTIVGNEVHTTNAMGADIFRAYGGGIGIGNLPDTGFKSQYMTNCIVWDNIADAGHGMQIAAMLDSYGWVRIRHCDIKDGENGVFGTFKWNVPPQPEDLWPGDGNIGDNLIIHDPQFVDPDGADQNPLTYEDNDYHIQSTSLCKDGGGSTLQEVPQDPFFDYDKDGNHNELIPFDFDSGARLYDDPAVPIDIVDIGADEYGSASLLCPPQTPVGPMKGIKGNPYLYTICANLENFGWPFYYQFDWDAAGSHDYSNWIGPFAYGESASLSHTWVTPGIPKAIKARVKIGINGLESGWSDQFNVRMYKLGDTNPSDDDLDFDDINPFVLMLSSGETAYYEEFPDGYWYTADINMDGVVDFGDINPFVALFNGGG